MTPYERDPRTDGQVLRERLRLDRQIAPPLPPRAVRAFRRLAAVAATLLFALWATGLVLWARSALGPLAALLYAVAVLGWIRLAWHRTPPLLVAATAALFVGSVILLFAGVATSGDAYVRFVLPFFMATGLNAILGTPPPTLRRLWHGDPPAVSAG